MTEKVLTVQTKEPIRADVAVAALLDITRSNAEKLFDGENVKIGDKPIKKNLKLSDGTVLSITVPDAVPLEAAPEDIPLDILFEDEDMLVVNKPKGMVVHPAAGHYDGTLVNALLAHCGDSLSGIGGVQRPGILHRIDKDTSGLLMVAKNDKAHNFLAAQIKDHSFFRQYETVVYGTFKEPEGDIDLPIGRHPVKRKQMAVTYQNSKPAKTHYKVISSANGFSHLLVTLYTGRTHQIRVHMSHIGHPVAGDSVYGPKKVITSLCGQCLHAKTLGFIHPKTGEYIELSSETPEYFKKFLKTNGLE